MKISLECTYCGHIWVETVYNQHSMDGKSCSNGNCKHKELKVRDLSSKIDYYKGSPPFPITFKPSGYWPM